MPHHGQDYVDKVVSTRLVIRLGYTRQEYKRRSRRASQVDSSWTIRHRSKAYFVYAHPHRDIAQEPRTRAAKEQEPQFDQ